MVETTTVMPTLLEDSGALSMIPLSPTNTPLLVPFTLAMEALETGMTAIGAVARTMLSMLTPTCFALKTGAIFIHIYPILKIIFSMLFSMA